TYLINTSTVNSLRVGTTRTRIEKVPDKNVGGWPDYGVNASSFDGTNSIGIVVSGNGFNFGQGNAIISIANTGPNYNVADDLSIVRGTHQLGFGANYIYAENAYHSGVVSKGNLTFNGQFSGLGLADYLLGMASQWSQGNVSTYYDRQQYIGIYAQDSWKMTPRLTINYGLRYEPYLSLYGKYGWFSHFDQKSFDQNVHSSLYANSPAGMFYPGDRQYECGNHVECNKWNEFFPRLGFAWD